jgi:hypothetical protein
MRASVRKKTRALAAMTAFASAMAACGSEEASFGQAGGILCRPLPNEVATGACGSSSASSGGLDGDGGRGGGGVFGAPYDPAANKPVKSMVAAHATTSGPKQPGDAIDCLSCHKTGGSAQSKPMAFGGRIVKGSAPAPDIDVVVVSEGATLGPVKTDQDGFFWRLGGEVKSGAKTHVRSASGVSSMSSPLGQGEGASCDSANCHVPGKKGKVNAP